MQSEDWEGDRSEKKIMSMSSECWVEPARQKTKHTIKIFYVIIESSDLFSINSSLNGLNGLNVFLT